MQRRLGAIGQNSHVWCNAMLRSLFCLIAKLYQTYFCTLCGTDLYASNIFFYGSYFLGKKKNSIS